MSDDRPVVLVTGAASGIGAACVARFAVGGWHTVGFDRVAALHADVLSAFR